MLSSAVFRLIARRVWRTLPKIRPSLQATEEGGDTAACYSVCVSLAEGEETANSRWSVQRKLTEFQMLHRKLTEVKAWVFKAGSGGRMPFDAVEGER